MWLFLVSLLIKLFSILFKSTANKHIFIWIFIIIAAIVYGAGHLLAMASITALTPLVITRTLIHGIAGIVFGWLYRRKSLAGAMIAHGTADIVLAFCHNSLLEYYTDPFIIEQANIVQKNNTKAP